MTSTLAERMLPQGLRFQDDRMDERALAESNQYLLEALTQDKREGLQLAVRLRWIALAIIAIMLPFLNFSWEVLYYEALIAGFALVGWAQLYIGQVGVSRKELALILCDLVLMTFTIVAPNPWHDEIWPTAMQYRFAGFSYFYVLLAAATIAYSWRTIFAFGTWTTGLWTIGMIGVAVFGVEVPELSAQIKTALLGNERMFEFLDPNSLHIQGRIQEIVIFLIVAVILGLNGRRNRRMVIKQAEVARERANLARHFPPTTVDVIADRDQPLGAVRSQTVTVMFTDIVGFTRVAERHSPEEVIAMLREFHLIMENAVFTHQGTLDKFLGDGVMATFGTPDPKAEDAANALRCADHMIQAMADWNRRRESAGQEAIKLSIGIHSGEVVLGDIGSERRLEFAVLGDAVNVASRLEALTRELNVDVVISQPVQAALGDASSDLLRDYQTGRTQQIRGRDDPIEILTYCGRP